MAESEVAVEQLAAQVRRLSAALAQQETNLSALRAEMRSARTGQTTAVVETPPPAPDELSTANELASPSGDSRHARVTSRRRLLTGAGTAAAAATVAAVALTHPQSASAASAAPAADGGNLVIGQTNQGTNGTSLTITGSSSVLNFFTVDASASTNANARAIAGASNTANGTGVYGLSSAGIGVSGGSTSGVAVLGDSAHGKGVYGISFDGSAVVGQSTSGVDLVANGLGRLQQKPQSFAGAPVSGAYATGEMIRDLDGELWLCTFGGTPGTWVKVAHLSPGATSGGATTYLSQSIRLLDTRVGFPALNTPGAPYGGGSTHTLTIAGVTYNGVTVPSNCVGAIGNLTAVSTSAGGGYLALVPHGTGFSGTANLAYGPNQIVGNFFSVVLSGGQVDIIVGGNTTDVVFDLFAVVS